MAEPTPVTTRTPEELSLCEPGATVAEQLDALPQFFNIDTLPTALARSVDIVTGGAAYGADALGGVTNFILDRQFKGVKLSAGTGMNDFNSDGQNYNVSFANSTTAGFGAWVIWSIRCRAAAPSAS